MFFYFRYILYSIANSFSYRYLGYERGGWVLRGELSLGGEQDKEGD
jgi:hypothetical protein